MRKFYIVNDVRNPYNGLYVPHKINYNPYMNVSQFNTGINDNIQYHQIKTAPGLTITPTQTNFGITTPMYTGPVVQKRYIGGPVMYGNQCPLTGAFTGTCGAPIIKYSLIRNQKTRINIYTQQTNQSHLFTIDVPYEKYRDVVNYIYLNARNTTPATVNDPKITFKLEAPGTSGQVDSTYSNMQQMINDIDKKYSGLTYFRNNNSVNLVDLLQELITGKKQYYDLNH